MRICAMQLAPMTSSRSFVVKIIFLIIIPKLWHRLARSSPLGWRTIQVCWYIHGGSIHTKPCGALTFMAPVHGGMS